MEIKNFYDQKPLWLQIIMGIGIALISLYLLVLIRNTLKEYHYIGKSSDLLNTIEIIGNGKVVAIPDIASISLGLESEKPTVAQAQADNTKKMNQLYDELKKIEIPKEDIMTTQYNVYPKYEWKKDSQIFLGYTVTQNVVVKIRNFEKIPNVLELIGTLGLNQVQNLFFTTDNPELLLEEARMKAIKNAKAKVQAIAKEAGVKLGKIISFTENSEPFPISPYKNYSMEAGIGGAQIAPSPNIEPGSQEFNVQVNISYEIL